MLARLTSRFCASSRASAHATSSSGVPASSGTRAAAIGGRVHHRVAQVAQEPQRAGRAGARRDQRELVTADAGEAVALPGHARRRDRHGLEHRVPGGVALLVVHALEVVEVDQDERVGVAGRRGALEREVEAAPVRHPGERVELGHRALVHLGAHEPALEELDGHGGPGHGEPEHHEPRGVAHVERPGAVVEERGGERVDEQRHQRPGQPRREEVRR